MSRVRYRTATQLVIPYRAVRQSRAATMFWALCPAAKEGDDVAVKLRSRISMASRAGMRAKDQDRIADDMLRFFFIHLDHTPDCPYSSTAQSAWEQLVDIGASAAAVFANNPLNHRDKS